MSDVSKNQALIAEAREVTTCRCVDAPEQECGTHGDATAKLIGVLLDALEAATRVPVQGEPNDDRKAAMTEADRRFPEAVFAPENEQLAEIFLSGAEFVLSRAVVPDAATAHSPVHFECNCVPNLGPTHCHACSDEVGNPVMWSAEYRSFTAWLPVEGEVKP